jgi:hypothetical protein
MIRGKLSYLNRLYDKVYAEARKKKQNPAEQVAEKVDGTSPPSVFIGRYGYPKVFIGPVLPPIHGDTQMMDFPEGWIPSHVSAMDIVNFRLQLIRGTQTVGIKEKSRFVDQIQEIGLAKNPLDMEAEFSRKPTGGVFHEEMQPYGPSAPLKRFEVYQSKFDPKLEKAHYDTDLLSKDAILDLYGKGLPVSTIQRAFSVGAFGLEKNRKLVPTRWSITAVDSTIGETILDEVKRYQNIGDYRVYEYSSLNNKFVVILVPRVWSYESMEAFFPQIIGDRLEIFGDWESHEKKREYAAIGGCYYSAKLAIVEQLKKEQKQATAIVLREAYTGYIPLGVWNVRENMRLAMQGEHQSFATLQETLAYADTRLKIRVKRWISETTLLRNLMSQTTISSFLS